MIKRKPQDQSRRLCVKSAGLHQELGPLLAPQRRPGVQLPQVPQQLSGIIVPAQHRRPMLASNLDHF